MKRIPRIFMAGVIAAVAGCFETDNKTPLPLAARAETQAIEWGKPVNGLSCAITSFELDTVIGVPCKIEASIKNVSTNDLLVPKVKGNLYANVILTKGDKQYEEIRSLPKSVPPPPMTRNDFILLRRNEVYSFHHTLVAAQKGYPPIIFVPGAGEYRLQLRYHAWSRPMAEDIDLGGLRPWTGTLISAPVKIRINSALTDTGQKDT